MIVGVAVEVGVGVRVKVAVEVGNGVGVGLGPGSAAGCVGSSGRIIQMAPMREPRMATMSNVSSAVASVDDQRRSRAWGSRWVAGWLSTAPHRLHVSAPAATKALHSGHRAGVVCLAAKSLSQCLLLNCQQLLDALPGDFDQLVHHLG